MTELAELYCPECDAEVLPRYREQPAHLAVRGEDTAYSEEIAVCPQCGHAIGDARIEGANLERAYDAYRAKHDIMSPAGIKSLRQSYGLSMREFSKFLGFGEQTTYRYERGDIPDQAHNNTLQSARTAAGARLLLSQNGSRLLPRSVKSIRQHLIALEYNSDEESHAATALEARESDTPSAATAKGLLLYGHGPLRAHQHVFHGIDVRACDVRTSYRSQGRRALPTRRAGYRQFPRKGLRRGTYPQTSR